MNVENFLMIKTYVFRVEASFQALIKHLKKKSFRYTMASNNKLVQTIIDAATLTGLAAGIG